MNESKPIVVVDHNPPKFEAGDIVRISVKFPIGHYRVPMYMRGKKVEIVRNLGSYINPEEEAFGKNAGDKMWCYMIKIPTTELWSNYEGQANDEHQIEVFENWLENIE
ncbi:MAG: SH3-like domain-containing protein [Mucilaginibacter sp.]|uniref:SH3-like domain-containing protein n=1 Tax=Mucilaginibacter sp. TaxID=1882438 RepID=UPI0031AA0803